MRKESETKEMKKLLTGQTKVTNWLRNHPRNGGHHEQGGTDVVSRLARYMKFAGVQTVKNVRHSAVNERTAARGWLASRDINTSP